jgi:hypothetical protein
VVPLSGPTPRHITKITPQNLQIEQVIVRNSYPRKAIVSPTGLRKQDNEIILQVLENGSQANRGVGIPPIPLPPKKWTTSEEWTLADSFI